jgi:hypothetical protein
MNAAAKDKIGLDPFFQRSDAVDAVRVYVFIIILQANFRD